MFGPSSVCLDIILYLSYAKTVLVEILFPVEVLAAFVAYIAILKAHMYEEDDIPSIYIGASCAFLSTTIVSLLFCTASWHAGFLVRASIYATAFIFSYMARPHQNRDSKATVGICLALFLILMLEVSTYAQAK